MRGAGRRPSGQRGGDHQRQRFCGTNSNPAYTFDADVDGTLSNGTATYVIDASIEGEFLT